MQSFKGEPTYILQGWNFLFYEDELPHRATGYIENITSSMTFYDPENRLSHKRWLECVEKSIQQLIMTLVLLKLHSKLQQCKGTIPLKVVYFAYLRYILDSFGAVEVLSNSGLIFSELVTDGLSGKHFNRCRRLYPLLAVAIQIQHFQYHTS